MPISRFTLATAVLLALLVGATALIAQSSSRIRVALVDALSVPEARAEILRFGNPSQKDLILLRADAANPRDLGVALEAYRQIRRRAPARTDQVARTTITSHSGAEHLSVDALRRAAEMIRAVRATSESRIGSLGRGRWEEFDVAP